MFGTIFERYYDDIYRYVVARLGPDLGADVASAVFLVAFARRDRFVPQRGDARPWLFGIATNLIRNRRRREARRLRALREASQDAWQLVTDETVPLDSDVRAALARLSRTQRDVVWLVDVIGLTYREAAAALRVPLGTAQSRLSRAHARLADVLGPAQRRSEAKENLP